LHEENIGRTWLGWSKKNQPNPNRLFAYLRDQGIDSSLAQNVAIKMNCTEKAMFEMSDQEILKTLGIMTCIELEAIITFVYKMQNAR